jgi:hypothetical protein
VEEGTRPVDRGPLSLAVVHLLSQGAEERERVFRDAQMPFDQAADLLLASDYGAHLDRRARIGRQHRGRGGHADARPRLRPIPELLAGFAKDATGRGR